MAVLAHLHMTKRFYMSLTGDRMSRDMERKGLLLGRERSISRPSAHDGVPRPATEQLEPNDIRPGTTKCTAAAMALTVAFPQIENQAKG